MSHLKIINIYEYCWVNSIKYYLIVTAQISAEPKNLLRMHQWSKKLSANCVFMADFHRKTQNMKTLKTMKTVPNRSKIKKKKWRDWQTFCFYLEKHKISQLTRLRLQKQSIMQLGLAQKLTITRFTVHLLPKRPKSQANTSLNITKLLYKLQLTGTRKQNKNMEIVTQIIIPNIASINELTS